MNPQCAACQKTVYPVEKLNCLDKLWHKGCFRCTACGMTLNMKNYKGYNKMPYCAAHYPTTKFTAVADTPENLRLKQNTTNQSNLVYHAEFEKMKGTKQTIADDLETRRAAKSAQIASEISYRGVKGQREEQEMHRPEQAMGDGYKQPGMYQPPPPSSQQGYQPPPNQPTSPSWNPQPAPGYGQIFNKTGRDPQQPWPSRQVPQQYKNSAPPQNTPYMPPPPAQSAAPKSAGPGYRAIYDYAAADEDEISFAEGDIIKDVTIIDDGWMEGRNTRTGEYGMLPSNYVERV